MGIKDWEKEELPDGYTRWYVRVLSGSENALKRDINNIRKKKNIRNVKVTYRGGDGKTGMSTYEAYVWYEVPTK